MAVVKAVTHIERNVRALRALNMRRNGKKLDEVAAELGPSREGARQLIKVGEEIERRIASTDPWDELSARARNALLADACEPTLDSVMTRYEQEAKEWEAIGYPISFETFLRRIPNIGEKTVKEIRDWLLRHNRETGEHENQN